MAEAPVTTGAAEAASGGNPIITAPFYINDTSRYHAYFHRSEPEIVFGSVDAGVANRQCSDGLTFLDVLWDQAPFHDKGAFLRAVEAVSSEWLRAALLTTAERQRVPAAARSDL